MSGCDPNDTRPTSRIDTRSGVRIVKRSPTRRWASVAVDRSSTASPALAGAWPEVTWKALSWGSAIHASAVVKDPRTYEHVDPEVVGNLRKVLVSDQGGRSNVLAELSRVGIVLGKGDPRVGRVLDEVKRKEAEGFAFEGADASFYVLVKRILRKHGYPPDKQEKATQTVLEQAALLSAEWVVA